MSLLVEQEWVVVDVETTGGSPAHGHRIIEVGAVVVSRGPDRGRYASLVNPRRPIPRVVASLTGITDEAVRPGAPVRIDRSRVDPGSSEGVSS
jgi:DNA polymerase III epsilon subunit-like protein